MVQAYAGDVEPRDAWKILADEPSSVLVDVRTDAEWSYVGLPDLGDVGKEPVLISWQLFPAMARNADFASAVEARGIARDAAILFLCRSGVRSRAAAIEMTGRGFTRCLNIAGGFEGDPDGERHRGRINGWKAHGLPWRQG